MPQEMERRAVDQLNYLHAAPALPSPTKGVSSVSGGPLGDNTRVGLLQFGPCKSHNDFHDFFQTTVIARLTKLPS